MKLNHHFDSLFLSLYNERRNKVPGLMECLWETGGVSCEVLSGGRISIGDSVVLLSPHESLIASNGRVPNDGGKPPAFYIRPKLRSAAMIKELLEGKKQTKKTLESIDKEGLLRLQRSYESVGLQF